MFGCKEFRLTYWYHIPRTYDLFIRNQAPSSWQASIKQVFSEAALIENRIQIMLTEARQIFIREKVPTIALSGHALGSKKFSRPNGLPISTLQSPAMSAILLFCFINLCCLIGKQLYGERKYKSTEHQISVFANSVKKPEVVLLGSSLMRTPLYICDFQHSHPSLYEGYCWDNTLQDLITPIKKHSVFNFAIDGCMISDAFLIHSKFLSVNSAPKWIVYGVAPRDFLDNYVSKETRTPLFDRMFDIEDILLAKSPFKITPSEKFDLVVEKICWLYRCRSDVQQHVISRIQRILQGEAFFVRNKNVTAMSLLQKESSSKNLRNYQKRFQTFTAEKFNRQTEFLDALCKQAIKNGTKILLVNMPLPIKITNLIPKSAYTAYQKTLTSAARMPGVSLLDLQNSNRFSSGFFGNFVEFSLACPIYLKISLLKTTFFNLLFLLGRASSIIGFSQWQRLLQREFQKNQLKSIDPP